MKISVLTLFPDMFTGVFGHSILQQAEAKGIVSYDIVDFRRYSTDKHKRVDDYPYGGGGGMVLAPQPLFDAVADVSERSSQSSLPRVILMCPQGEPYTQKKAEELAAEEHLILICGHYEGYDERIREHLVTDEISLGDYVLTGGEIGAMAVTDSVVRLLPGALGNDESAVSESHSTGLLEYPHYTRPADFRGMKVPDILLSGHHKNINEWRRKQALKRTKQKRPDLLHSAELTQFDRDYLEQLESEKNG